MLERAFGNSISSFLDRNHILNPHQYGCRRGYSAPDALLKLVNDIRSRLEAKPRVKTSAIMVDIKGAFDNVDHQHLLSILSKHNFPAGTILWVNSFITDRRTALVTDGIVDDFRPTNKGIPQGSPLSPILFNIYTTDLYQKLSEIPGIKFAGYVDDVTIYCHGLPFRATASLSKALKTCTDWADSAHTAIDLGDKLNFIHFGPKGSTYPSLPIPGSTDPRPPPPPQNTVKVLGITLDRQLTFGPHIKIKKEQAIRALNFITRLGGTTNGLSGSALKLLYTTCVIPIVAYGVSVWGYNPKIVQRMGKANQPTQNIALRRILGAFRTTTIYILHKETGIPPLHIKLEDLTRKAANRLRTTPRIHQDNPAKLQNLTNTVADAFQKRIDLLETTIRNSRIRIKPPLASIIIATQQWKNEHQATLSKLENSPHLQWYRKTYSSELITMDASKLQLRKALRGPRHILSGIIQLKTGHGKFAQYITNRTKNEDNILDKCPKCGLEPENPRHIITTCPSYGFIPPNLRNERTSTLFMEDSLDIISKVIQAADLAN